MLKMTAKIYRGTEVWFRELNGAELNKPVWFICAETQRQFESDAWLKSKKFVLLELPAD